MDIRLFVRKKKDYQVESQSLAENLRNSFGLDDDFNLIQYNIYDIYNADQEDIDLLKQNVIAEAVTDEIFEELPVGEEQKVLAYEYLPGQYDQRADSAQQCLMLFNNKNDIRIHSGTALVMDHVSDEDLKKLNTIRSTRLKPAKRI